MTGNGAQRNYVRIAVASVAGIAIIALIAAVGLLCKDHREDEQIEQTRADATTAARELVVQMFAYDSDTADAKLHDALNRLTGDFKEQYKTVIETAIIPAVKGKQVNVSATVEAAGVTSAGEDDAVVLVYLNQLTTGPEFPNNPITASRLRVSLDRSDGEWLISGLEKI